MSSKPCTAKTKTGAPCGAPATEGGLCYFHSNPEKVRELGRAGGRKNRHCALEAPTLPAEMNAAGVRDILAQAMVDVRQKTLSPNAASALAQLSNALLRVMPFTELEKRIAELERVTAQSLAEPREVKIRPNPSESPMFWNKN